MTVVVGVFDQCGNTDNIIVVNTKEKSLTWVPRDLYSYQMQNRINCAYAFGGHSLLASVLREFGFEIEYSVCVPNKSIQSVLSNYSLTVPIANKADYYYPVTPFEPIENGKKIISFTPPMETLAGERIHQFLGARTRVNSADYLDLPDYERIVRQMVFFRQMLLTKFDFSVFLEKKMYISDPIALQQLAQVNFKYHLDLYKKCQPAYLNNQWVLIPFENQNKSSHSAKMEPAGA